MSEAEQRAKIREARDEAWARRGTLYDSGPLPELYPGHYEEMMGLEPSDEAFEHWLALHGLARSALGEKLRRDR